MKKTINVKEKFIIIALLIVVSLLLFYPVIFESYDFAWYNDQHFQFNIFYKEYHRIIREIINSKTLSVYSWNTFLGTDFFVSKLMYCIGDFVALPIFVIFETIENYNYVFLFETIICTVLSGITINLYFNEIKIKNIYLRILFSLVYALGGFAIIYLGTYMFHRFFALLPLLFYYIERYRNNNELVGFAIIVALLFLQNYELMFSTSLFLVLYYIFINKLDYYDKKIYEIIKTAIPLIVTYLIGIFLCGIVLIPLIIFISTNTRVATMDYGDMFWDFKVIMGLVSNIFCPAVNLRSDFPPYLFYSGDHFGSEQSIYTTCLFVLSLINILINKNDKDKKVFIYTELILIAFVMIRPLNMIVHGFSEPTLRWTCLVYFFHILLSIYSLDKYEYKKNNYTKAIVLVYILALIIYVVINDFDINRYFLSIAMLILSSTSIFIYEIFLLNKKYVHLIVMTIAVLTILQYMMVNEMILYKQDTPAFNQEYIDYFKNNDSDKMFRYYFNVNELQPFNSLNLNASIEHDYMSTQTYDSTYENVLNDFISLNGYEGWILDINRPDLLKMLGVKYIGVLNDETLINQIDVTYAYNLDDIKVYKVNDYNHIGHTYSNFVKRSEIEETHDWINQLIVYDEDYELVSDIVKSEKAQLNVIEYNRQYMKAIIDVDSKQVLLMTIPYSDGWNVVDQNGYKQTTINVQGGFLGVILDENVNELNFYYLTPGLKTGIIVSGIGFIGLLGLLVLDIKKKKI